jgi:fructose-bisphosphate aldolase class II
MRQLLDAAAPGGYGGLSMTAAIRTVLADSPGGIDPRAYLGAARDAMQRIVAERTEQFGRAGQAFL